MKRFFLFQIMMLAAVILSSCSKDPDNGANEGPAVEAVPLSYELSTYSTTKGGSVDVIFKVTSDALTQENVVLTLSAMSGTENVSSTYFVDFSGSVTFPKGKGEFTETLTLKDDIEITELYNAIELQVFSRGYVIAGGTTVAGGAQSHTLRVYDSYVTSVALTAGATEVKEGEIFALQASIPVASKSDVVVNVAYSDQGFTLSNLPETLVIPAGDVAVVSDAVTVELDGIYTGDVELTLDLSTTSEDFPLALSELTFKVKDIDTPLGDEAQDERWVYENPSVMFVSSDNKSAVDEWGKTNYIEMAKGDAHPSATLASKWNFYTSLEFHNIAACYTEDATYDTKLVKGLAAQNTVLFEEVAAVQNNRFSTITDEGNLNMWVMKVPSTTTCASASGQSRDYGSAAFYSSKFAAAQDDASKCWATNLVRILPGTRVETRAKITGQKKGMNMAIWLQGNSFSSLEWPLYGEVDVLENPASTSTDNTAHYTFHLGSQSDNTYANPTANNTINNMNDYNIYWFEYIDESTVAIGVNGKEMKRISKSDYPNAKWPFDMTTNPYGLHYLLTMGVASDWALGSVTSGWDSGFASFTNYANDRFNAEVPRMEIDWIRYYTASNYDDSKPVNTMKLY
ncbi:MAG: DUF5006 domain-containing protein [Rikenellaceae bacterium]